MVDLDKRATSEQQVRDELGELRERNHALQNLVEYHERSLQGREDTIRHLKKEKNAVLKNHNELIGTLTKSGSLHKLVKLLERFPAKFRPKAFDDFFETMELVNKECNTT